MASHSSAGSAQSKSGSPSARKASYAISPSNSPPSASGSSISMTSGLRLHFASAALIVGENSRSVISAFASPWSRVKAMVLASSRIFSVLSTAPAIGTPKWAS